jgi:hypothetical protein
MGADLVVLGKHGRSGVERIRIDSATESFLRSADLPVLIVPPRNRAESSAELSAVVSPPAVERDDTRIGDAFNLFRPGGRA